MSAIRQFTTNVVIFKYKNKAIEFMDLNASKS